MLLQGLYEFYERAIDPGPNSEALIEDPAFQRKFIRWLIPLDTNGNLLGNGLIEAQPINKGGIELSLPRTTRPKNQGGVAEFLWGDPESVFGISTKTDPPQFQKIESEKFNDFWRQIEEASVQPNLAFLRALLKFRDKYILPETANLIEYRSLEEGQTPALLVRTSSGEPAKLKTDYFTFEINGETLVNKPSAREYWKHLFKRQKEQNQKNAASGVCLVTGELNVPISASHMPKISGVPDAGAAIVSFDKPAFCSYGFEQSLNSPVSMYAVEAYTNALNYLLKSPRHRVRVGSAALVFWAQKSEAPTDLFAELFETPNEDSIRKFMMAPFSGVPAETDPENERFYSVVLTGNGGRVVVRSWLQSTVAAAIENFRSWFRDLELIPYQAIESDKYHPLSLNSLARSTVRDPKELRTETVTQLFRSALEATPPSMMIAGAILGRIAIDLSRDRNQELRHFSRYALLRLIINRNKKEKDPMIEPSLTVETDDPAYNCGRLLAIFDRLQAEAHEYKLEGSGVVERYYGTASSSPNSAFGILWRLHQHHLKKLSRSNGAKAAAIKNQIAEIAAQFRPAGPDSPPSFPRVFGLAEQGRFALGFYQQWAATNAAIKVYKAKNETTSEGEQQDE
ncbi:MAG: type I-C CRISPR-associated protein Cas8c/Csd1 [Blastocatellia bacterium]